jgi:hypothetical protein
MSSTPMAGPEAAGPEAASTVTPGGVRTNERRNI